MATATPPHRFHLLIGAASSGKSTAAQLLANDLLLRSPSSSIRYISSANIRQQLYGDPSILGRWQEIEAVIQQQIEQAIADGATVILEASYVRRAFRLAITQALPWRNWLRHPE